MLERLAELDKEFLDVEARLGDPDLIADQPRYQLVAKRYRELEPIVERTRELRAPAGRPRHGPRDADRRHRRRPRDMLRAEVDAGRGGDRRGSPTSCALLLLPRDPNDERNVIVEIRGAEGGEEANLFARDLFEMYRAFAARQGWSVDVLGHRPVRPRRATTR